MQRKQSDMLKESNAIASVVFLLGSWQIEADWRKQCTKVLQLITIVT